MATLPPNTSPEKLMDLQNSVSLIDPPRNSSIVAEPALIARFFACVGLIVATWLVFVFAKLEPLSTLLGWIVCGSLTAICGYFALKLLKKANLRRNGKMTTALIVRIKTSVSVDGDTHVVYYDYLENGNVMRGKERLSDTEAKGLSEGGLVTILFNSHSSRIWKG